MNLPTILKDILPTKWSRYIAALTALLVIPVSRLPLYWPLSKLVTTKIEIQLFQALLSILTILIGALIILIIVLNHLKNSKILIATTAKKTELPQFQKDILLYLYKNIGDTLTFQIIQTLNISEDIVKYHLQELLKEQFVDKGPPVLPGQQSWNITDNGKKYLIENKIIT